ncbi:DUF1758 domain-containing protein [Trichonephila clavata]|uniref:DUF1758 domain-containing protein n=1 Tax=Trichonephila clavata TaxID=2740835 RepID=A0A8X6LRL8_TRICU|nr:DUF1758 domain-containing protein [Trichonephila clavata]
MELDRLKKKRAAFKSSTTKLLKRIDESKDSIYSSELDDLLNLLQGKIDNIKILDEQIVDLTDANDIEAEIERSEEYYEKKERGFRDAVVSNVAHNNSEIYFQTAAGQFIGRKGSSLIRRIIYDGGSQRTFLESKLGRELNLPVVGQEILTVHTFQSERPTKHVYPKVRIRVKSLISNKEIEIEALETKQLSSAQISIPAKEVRERFESLGLELADVPMVLDKGACEIGLLVGSDNYWKFVGNRIERLDESLVAVETIFGFCIHGSVSEDKDNDEASVNFVVSKESISHQLNQFWQLENLGIEVEEDIKDISENEILKSFESSLNTVVIGTK